MTKTTCSCGNHEDHIIARRMTADGKSVLLWSDGSLTWALGHAIRGSAHPRTTEQRNAALRAGRLVLGDVCLYDASEVSALVSAARWAAARDGLPGTMRSRLSAMSRPKLRPQWTVLSTDARGRTTVRVWRLNRIQYPGLAIWHERGRYSVMSEIGRSGTFQTTGITGTTLSSVLAILQQQDSPAAGATVIEGER
jgi:hypothetical protein